MSGALSRSLTPRPRRDAGAGPLKRVSHARLALSAGAALAIGLSVTVGSYGRDREEPPTAGPLRVAPDGRKLTLTFSDEFNAFRPRTDRGGVWRTTFGDGRVADLDQRTIRKNGELQLYVDADMKDASGEVGINPFTVKDGVLQITASVTPPSMAGRLGGYAWTSGLISSQPSFSQRYGYFEMRAALPEGKGLWPAFWLLPADLSWPPEIDIMESIGDPSHVYVAGHSAVAKTGGGEARISGHGFHIFAVAWNASQVIWYVDGAEVGREPTPADMNKPMFILANLAIGGGWAGRPEASTRFPAHYAIDYIRAYQFRP